MCSDNIFIYVLYWKRKSSIRLHDFELWFEYFLAFFIGSLSLCIVNTWGCDIGTRGIYPNILRLCSSVITLASNVLRSVQYTFCIHKSAQHTLKKKAHRSLETLMHLVGSKGGGKWALIQLEASESDECISMELPFLNIFQNNACIYCRWISDASEESIHRMKYHELCNESIINTIWFWFASICF